MTAPTPRTGSAGGTGNAGWREMDICVGTTCSCLRTFRDRAPPTAAGATDISERFLHLSRALNPALV